MKNVALLLLVCFVFLGCESKVTSKTKIVFKCIDGKLYGDSYLYLGRDEGADVLMYPRHKNELVIEDGIEIWCKNTKDSK